MRQGVRVLGDFVILPGPVAVKRGSVTEARVFKTPGGYYVLVATACLPKSLDEILTERPKGRPVKKHLLGYGASVLGPFGCADVAADVLEEVLSLIDGRERFGEDYLEALLEHCAGSKKGQECLEFLKKEDPELHRACLERSKRAKVRRKKGKEEQKARAEENGVKEEKEQGKVLYPGELDVDPLRARRYFLPLLRINAPAAKLDVLEIRTVPGDEEDVIVTVRGSYGSRSEIKRFRMSLEALKLQGIVREKQTRG